MDGFRTLKADEQLAERIVNVLDEEDPVKHNTQLPVTTSIYDWRGRVFRLGLGVSFE